MMEKAGYIAISVLNTKKKNFLNQTKNGRIITLNQKIFLTISVLGL